MRRVPFTLKKRGGDLNGNKTLTFSAFIKNIRILPGKNKVVLARIFLPSCQASYRTLAAILYKSKSHMSNFFSPPADTKGLLSRKM